MDKDLIYGIRPVVEALKAGRQLDKIMVQRTANGTVMAELRTLAAAAGVEVQPVPGEKLNRLTRKNHQGVVAFTSPVAFHDISLIIPSVYEKGETPLVLILDRVTDVRNFGAIVRTAECAGVHAVVVPARGTARISDETAKTSAGALFSMPVCKSLRPAETITFLKESGLQVVACTEKAGKSVFEARLSGPAAIVVGSEEDGISPDLLKLCDDAAHIPLHGKIASLNVSVAAGIVLYETLRQRG